ncbi:MAG: Cof-type HAD-IIB family hydrolase [Mycoplasmataceae bacterium]|nr:Cof-type HAD-IIB family hydrolase [Mycoplasmataceae bacterium]
MSSYSREHQLVDIPKILVVSDLDGTLLKSNNTISQSTIDVIKKFTDRGNIFCIATGRPKRAAIKYYEQLKLNSLLINYNGSYITNPSNPKFTPLNLGFSNDILRKIMNNKNILKHVNNILVENTEGDFIWKKPKSEKERFALFNHFHITSKSDKYSYIKPKLANITADVHSILLHIKSDKYIDDLSYEIKSIANTLIVRHWNVIGLGTIIEINSVFSSKGMALKYLSSYYGIPLENCLAFGDGDNDAEMLRTAFFGFAMKNGTTTAKLSARYMTQQTNNEDGVAIELRKFFNL